VEQIRSCSIIWKPGRSAHQHGYRVHKGRVGASNESNSAECGDALVKVEIDDSDFHFPVGFIFAHPGDKSKLLEQIRKVSFYETSAGVGDEIIDAMNIVSYNTFPGNRSNRRMMLRLEVLHDNLMNAK